MTASHASAPVSDKERKRILVADDVADNRQLMGDILDGQGYEVTLVEDGQKALDTALAHPPDTVVLDIMMPKLDGYTVCRRLRQDSRTAHIPILLVSALKERNDRVIGIEAGADDFLTKPVDVEELRLRVRNAVQSKRLYDQVQHSYRELELLVELRDHLTQFIVHDLKAPCCGVLMNLELLSKGLYGPVADRQQDCLERTSVALRQLMEMINSLLDVKRLEAGQLTLAPAPVDVKQLAQEALASLGSLVDRQRVQVRVPSTLPALVCDGALIRRVLVNLIDNAAKAMPRGGDLVIDAACAEGCCRVSVSDTGRGIPAAYTDRIFEKFCQVPTDEGRAAYSTGLGLTFCKLAVEAHGGQIGVHSREGQGSTFWFRLPCLPSRKT